MEKEKTSKTDPRPEEISGFASGCMTYQTRSSGFYCLVRIKPQ